MGRIPDTTSLLQEIREQSNEHNTAAFSDDAIIRAVNRGLRWITSELARTWEEPLVCRISYLPQYYDREVGFPLPEDCFEDRVTFAQTETPAAPTPIPFRSYSQVSTLDIRGSRSFVPVAAVQRGRALFFYPQPAAQYPISVFYVRTPDPIVQTIGRVITANATPDSLTLDPSTFDATLVSAASDDRASYVNLIDGMTGEILATRQVQRIDGSKLSFRNVTTRGFVEGRQVEASFDGVDVEPDMYVCPVVGTCIPQLGTMFSTFLVQYAVAEIGRALSDTLIQISSQIEQRAAEAARQQRQGRPNTLRVKNRSKVWGAIRPSAYPYVPT